MYSGEAVLHFVIGLILGAPLLYAAASKLLDPSRFVGAIPRFGIGLLKTSASSARVVGLLEFAGGAALATFPLALTGVAAGVLYLGLGLILLRARIRGTTGDCGCFGALASGIDAPSVARNLALALGSFGVGYLRSQGQLAPYEPAAAAALVVAFTLGAAATDTILEVRRRPA